MKFLRTRFPFIKKLRRLDYIFILIFFVIFASLIIARYLRKPQWIIVKMYVSNEEWWWEASEPSYWLVDDIKAGFISKNVFGEEIARVNDIQIFNHGDSKKIAFLEIQLKATYDRKKDIYIFDSKPLVVGRGLNLTFGNYNVRGIVAYFGDVSQQFESAIEVKLKITELDSDLAKALFPGLKMTDSNGVVLAEVLDVFQEIHSEYEFSDIRGEMIKVFDPDYVDVFLTVRLKAYRSGQDFYYVDGAALKIGSQVWFHFDNFITEETLIIDLYEL